MGEHYLDPLRWIDIVRAYSVKKAKVALIILVILFMFSLGVFVYEVFFQDRLPEKSLVTNLIIFFGILLFLVYGFSGMREGIEENDSQRDARMPAIPID